MGGWRRTLVALSCAAAALGQAAAVAAAERNLRASALTQINPAGLQLDASLGWSWRLGDSDAPLLRDAHISLGLGQALSPAHSRTQAWLELAPLSILSVRASADYAAYFGTFGHLVGVPSYASDFSDDARRLIEDRAEAAAGPVLSLAPALRLAVGRVALASTASFEWWYVDAPRTYFYEPFRDTLLAAEGDSSLTLQTLLLYDVSHERDRTRQVGVFHDAVDVGDAPGNRRQRLGPFVVWRLSERRFGVAEPTVVAGLLPYVEARHRSGLSAILLLGFRLGR